MVPMGGLGSRHLNKTLYLVGDVFSDLLLSNPVSASKKCRLMRQQQGISCNPQQSLFPSPTAVAPFHLVGIISNHNVSLSV